MVAKWDIRRIADALVSLSEEDAKILDDVILTTIKQAELLDDDAQLRFITNLISATFMVTPGATKEHQRSKIEEEINNLKQIPNNNKAPLVVFAMNPSNEGAIWWEFVYVV